MGPPTRLILPRLYAIVDAGLLTQRGISLQRYAAELRTSGVLLVQYRNKLGTPQEVLREAAVLRGAFGLGDGPTPCPTPRQATRQPDMGHPWLIMNDRADLAALAGFHGVHVGQEDLSPEDAKSVLLRTTIRSSGIVGVSTHTEAQVRVADAGTADYIAIGPVFATGTKADAEPVVGLEGVRRARALTDKPLVAIGGITRANAGSVLDAGADSLAVISGLFADGESVASVVVDFHRLLGEPQQRPDDAALPRRDR